jgi:hypothetical protein
MLDVFFDPEAGGDMFLRNILGYNIFSSVLNQPQFILPLG